MPKSVPSTDLDLIVFEVAKYPAGIGVDALHQALQGKPARRTLQRHLAVLVKARRLITRGEGRALRYREATNNDAGAIPGRAAWPGDEWDRSGEPADDTAKLAEQSDVLRSNAEIYVPTSPEGEEIKGYVRRPLQQRRPVSYNMAFLEAYVPNRTAYLPVPLRVQLHALGRSSVEQGAPAGTFARDILNRLLIDLSWASSQLEGNTYTRLDTERLIQFGQAAEGKDALETQMILNHKAAIEYLVGDARVADDADTVIALHALLSDGLLRDPTAGGRVRHRAVEIGGSVYRPIALPQRLEELFGIVMRMAAEIDDPFEQTFFLMVHLPYLQPFEDVNKRVSRLAANISLMRNNLCPLSFIDVPIRAYVDGMLGVYELARIELLRDVFVWAYERSCQQYVAVQQQLMPPDTFRLRYRTELTVAVKAIVQQGLRLDAAALGSATPAAVAPDDRSRFAALLRSEFDTLHPGNAVRFGLRPLEFAAWQAQPH